MRPSWFSHLTTSLGGWRVISQRIMNTSSRTWKPKISKLKEVTLVGFLVPSFKCNTLTFFNEVGFLALGTSLCFPFFISGALESKGLCGVFTWLKWWLFFPDMVSLERTGTAPTATQWGGMSWGGLPEGLRGSLSHPAHPHNLTHPHQTVH